MMFCVDNSGAELLSGDAAPGLQSFPFTPAIRSGDAGIIFSPPPFIDFFWMVDIFDVLVAAFGALPPAALELAARLIVQNPPCATDLAAEDIAHLVIAFDSDSRKSAL